VVVAHPDWERALVRVRRRLTDRMLAGEAVPMAAVHALGRHGWASEHAWPIDGPIPDDPAARAMFEGPSGADGDVDAVPELTPDDASSAAVRAIYEESPYPRLVSVHLREPVPFAQALRRILPGATGLPEGPIDVLVAGCGTGRHALQSAIGWQDARVLGVDLSRRSLALAAALARDLGVRNLEVGRADLLRLGELGRTFEVVEAVGVLHHLEDPLAGWRVLLGLLRPGGVMRIGLYSERGRADVVAARALVAEHGLAPTPDGLRAARQLFLGLPDDHPARPVVWSPDFYSLSGLRDLVFHVREHRYTLPRLGAELDALGLELLGFQHALPQVAGWYRSRWPEDERQVDLGRWEEVEEEHPRAFSGMYVFWCRRSAG
jgi:SAM-dependent methyltransferase